MTETKIADLVGLAEIAERCSVNRNVASGWTRKHNFPRPKHQLRMGPMWDWTEIQDYVGPKFTHRQEVAILCAHCGGEGDFQVSNVVAGGAEQHVLSADLHCRSCGKETSLEIFTGRDRLALFTDLVGGNEEDHK